MNLAETVETLYLSVNVYQLLAVCMAPLLYLDTLYSVKSSYDLCMMALFIRANVVQADFCQNHITSQLSSTLMV